MKRLWEWWKKFSLVFGTFMSRVILTVLYFVLLPPYGLIVRFFSDPLQMKVTPAKSAWKPHSRINGTLKELLRQY